MPEVILPGASGRIEGRYSPGKRPNAPIALILHPHPKAGGHMNNPVTVTLHQLFQQRGCQLGDGTLAQTFEVLGVERGHIVHEAIVGSPLACVIGESTDCPTRTFPGCAPGAKLTRA